MTAEAVLQTDLLTKRYGDFVAVEDLTLSVNRGQILGLIGHNGAGKSTTIRMLVGQSRPSSGTATIAGVDSARDFNAIKRIVGYMPDVFGIYENMRVHEYLDFFAAAFGLARRTRDERIAQVMQLAGVDVWKDRFVESLSHGMKQRVAIARTLIHDPQVLILDEPVNGLDPQARIEVRNLMRQLADEGKTLIVSSHILPELTRICDVVAILARSRLRAFGTVDDITQQLRQRRMYEVFVTSSDHVESARRIVTAVLGEQAAAAVSLQERAIRFFSDGDEQQSRGLLAELVTAGVAVTQFREVAADLEEAFMIIAEDQRNDPPDPGDPPCSA